MALDVSAVKVACGCLRCKREFQTLFVSIGCCAFAISLEGLSSLHGSTSGFE